MGPALSWAQAEGAEDPSMLHHSPTLSAEFIAPYFPNHTMFPESRDLSNSVYPCLSTRASGIQLKVRVRNKYRNGIMFICIVPGCMQVLLTHLELCSLDCLQQLMPVHLCSHSKKHSLKVPVKGMNNCIFLFLSVSSTQLGQFKLAMLLLS